MTAQSSTVWEVRIQFYVESLLKQKFGRGGRKRQSQSFPATVLLHFFLIKHYQSSYWNGVAELFHFYIAIMALRAPDEVSRPHGVLHQEVHFSSSEMNESLNLWKLISVCKFPVYSEGRTALILLLGFSSQDLPPVV